MGAWPCNRRWLSYQRRLLMLATTVTLLAVSPLASNVVKRVDKRTFSVTTDPWASGAEKGNIKTRKWISSGWVGWPH